MTIRLTVIDGGGHETEPDPDTVRAVTGERVSLLGPPPGSFPLAAKCSSCGEAIRVRSPPLF